MRGLQYVFYNKKEAMSNKYNIIDYFFDIFITHKLMNDELHHNLCTELNELFITMLSTTEMMRIVDSNKYKDIFGYRNLTYNDIIDIIIFIGSEYYDILLHIIFTRKIIFSSGVIANIASSLNIKDDIIKFFSFYNDTEINNIICYDIYNSMIYNGEQYYKTTLILYCITYKNTALYEYIMHYSNINILSIFPLSTNNKRHTAQCLNIYNLYKPDIDIIYDHEKTVIFRRSLRYAWMTSCILLVPII